MKDKIRITIENGKSITVTVPKREESQSITILTSAVALAFRHHMKFEFYECDYSKKLVLLFGCGLVPDADEEKNIGIVCESMKKIVEILEDN